MGGLLDLVISGIIVPFAAPIFTRAGFSKKTNGLIVLAFCMVAAAVQQQLAGNLSFSPENGVAFLESLGVIVTVSQGFYRLFKEPIEGIEAGVENALAVRSASRTENLKTGAKVLLTDEINRQIEQQVSERITRIMGVKDVMPVAEDESEEVFDDYERVAG